MAERWNTSKILEKVPKCLNSANVDGMLVQFLLMSDVDHRISSETFVYRPNSPVLFPLIALILIIDSFTTSLFECDVFMLP